MAVISINRAGKVRAQTPQCPKKEKPRKRTGRAYLRIKYNKRMEMGYFEKGGKVKLNVQVRQ